MKAKFNPSYFVMRYFCVVIQKNNTYSEIIFRGINGTVYFKNILNFHKSYLFGEKMLLWVDKVIVTRFFDKVIVNTI